VGSIPTTSTNERNNMKSEIKDIKVGWKPVTLELTFETKAELTTFLLLHNDITILQDIVQEQLEKNNQFEKHGIDEKSIYEMLPYETWQTLADMLDD
jgi:hypothetical protein